jgi:hypothetical protein
MKSTGVIGEPGVPALRVVTDAKRLLDEAQDWWPWSWASEVNKSRLRSAIETATEALAREVEKAKN